MTGPSSASVSPIEEHSSSNGSEPTVHPNSPRPPNGPSTPVDGAQPPHCPFTDVTKRRGVVETETGTLTDALDDTANNWSDVHVANVSVSLHVRLGERTISASFSGEGATCSSLLMSRPVVAGSIQAIATKFSLISE